MKINFIIAKYKNIPICNTATFTLIVFMLQITKISKEQYLDTLAACNIYINVKYNITTPSGFGIYHYWQYHLPSSIILWIKTFSHTP